MEPDFLRAHINVGSVAEVPKAHMSIKPGGRFPVGFSFPRRRRGCPDEDSSYLRAHIDVGGVADFCQCEKCCSRASSHQARRPFPCWIFVSQAPARLSG